MKKLFSKTAMAAALALLLAISARAVRSQLAHYQAMRKLATDHGELWGVRATAELIRRHEQELAWLAELGELAREEP